MDGPQGWGSRDGSGDGRDLITIWILMAPLWGISTPRAPNYFCNKERKNKSIVIWSQSRRSGHGLAQYSTCAKLHIFPMVSACALAPWALGPQNALKTKISFCCFPICVLSFWGALGAMAPWCHSGAIARVTYSAPPANFSPSKCTRKSSNF